MRLGTKRIFIMALSFSLAISPLGNGNYGSISAKAKTTTNQTVKSLSIPAKVTATSLRVRTGASLTAEQLKKDNQEVFLFQNADVTIIAQKVVKSQVWYQVKFTYNNVTTKGYVLSDYVKLKLAKKVNAKINSIGNVKIRKAAGTNKAYLKVNSKVVSLKDNKAVSIIAETNSGEKKWFQVSFQYSNKTYKGYLQANSVVFKANTSASATPAAPTKLNVTATPKVTSVPSMTPTPKVTATPKVTTKPTTTPIVVITATPKVTPTPKPTATPSVTSTPKPTATPVVSVTPTVAPTATPTATPKPTANSNKAKATTSAVNVRIGPGTDYDKLLYNEKAVQLTASQAVTVLGKCTISKKVWYYISFTYSNVSLKGYVLSSYIAFDSGDDSNIPVILTDDEFETALTEQGFPESYKDGLRTLHKNHPLWYFEAFSTGLNWSTVIKNETVLGVNLIGDYKSIDWKSFADKAYNWSTDKFIPYDGSTWVNPSKAAVEYYMDPRNFFNESSVFQFERLSYNKQYQDANGVEGILSGTPMSKTKYSYVDDDTKKTKNITYADTFIKAAEYSGVSPLHLAARVRQEVVKSSTTFSDSVTGTVSGYEGYFNFYNIGATHSTVAGGSIKNALNYAKSGSTAANNKLFLIPWNNRYKSVVGGAKFIGNNYISKGQDTIYLQKFNVTATGTYAHQYMANVEAPNSESAKAYAVYKEMEQVPLVFSIPVYTNMPEKACPVPSGVKNPNNWLKTLAIGGYSLTPAFKITNAETQEYTVAVGKSVTSVKVTATAVSTKAKVTGTGTKELTSDKTKVTIKVTAEDGTVRKYILNIVKL